MGDGYGRLKIKKNEIWGHVGAHQFSWALANGPIPDGMNVLHACDNPPCVRVGPGHLFLGTHQDNMKDMAAKGRIYGRGGRKLNAAQVRLMRSLYSQGVSQRVLMAQFGVVRMTVYRIVHNMTWKFT